MLDKSIEYKNIVMVMDADKITSAPEPVLPEGFSFRFFDGEDDIDHWCRIETAVEEFDSEEDARKRFMEEFYPHMDEMRKRCSFIVNKGGLPIATANCWFSNCEIESRMHWVAVCPEYQGLGLGKAICQRAINVSAQLSPGEKMWLSTQTWSHRAVLMYHKLGFNMLKSKIALGSKNSYSEEFDSAIEVLAGVLKPADTASLRDSAV